MSYEPRVYAEVDLALARRVDEGGLKAYTVFKKLAVVLPQTGERYALPPVVGRKPICSFWLLERVERGVAYVYCGARGRQLIPVRRWLPPEERTGKSSGLPHGVQASFLVPGDAVEVSIALDAPEWVKLRHLKIAQSEDCAWVDEKLLFEGLRQALPDELQHFRFACEATAQKVQLALKQELATSVYYAESQQV